MGAKRKAIAAITFVLLTAPAVNASAEAQTAAAVRPGAVELHFAPTENLERIDLGLLGTARKSVDLAAYNLSDHAVIQALCRLSQAGVRVRVYLDGEQLANTLRQALPTHPLYRLAREPHAEVRVKQAKGLMHLKAYLVDGQVLRTGSSNFSASGLKRQDNDLLIVRDAIVAQQFVRTFERLWARPDNRVWRPER